MTAARASPPANDSSEASPPANDSSEEPENNEESDIIDLTKQDTPRPCSSTTTEPQDVIPEKNFGKCVKNVGCVIQ